MKRAVPFLVLPFLLAGCSETPAQDDPGPAPTAVTSSSAAEQGPPPPPEPVADGPCPYLESSFIAEANGQRVTKVRVSADKPHPACFFYRADGGLQLTVRVFSGSVKQATAVVDEAAPVATSNPVTSPAGWKGGSLSADSGAVYAVTKQGTAVVATTNQQQAFKARQVVEKAISTLGL